MSGHNVVIASLPMNYKGTAPVATVASHMEHTFPSITLRLLVGIGGGVPTEEVNVRLGDIVVSSPKDTHGGVVQYDFGRHTSDGLLRTGFLCPPPSEWLHVLPIMMSDQRRDRGRRPNCITEHVSDMIKVHGLDEYKRPSIDVLYYTNRTIILLVSQGNVITVRKNELWNVPNESRLTTQSCTVG
ncbi:hypothetical protein FQN50_000504 [Emmonsiellopsis sp. PD_5]|nr:hypothetical protein FQN50_000504 [Emmonsiellopsis sp. PD_5]